MAFVLFGSVLFSTRGLPSRFNSQVLGLLAGKSDYWAKRDQCMGQICSIGNSNVAPGFSGVPKDAKVAIMPSDIEIFSISGGGLLEPRADWTEAATRNFRGALQKRKGTLGLNAIEVSERDVGTTAYSACTAGGILHEAVNTDRLGARRGPHGQCGSRLPRRRASGTPIG